MCVVNEQWCTVNPLLVFVLMSCTISYYMYIDHPIIFLSVCGLCAVDTVISLLVL